MDLNEPLTAECLGANLCIVGVTELSRLPKGTLLKFPSGAELSVEEYNPPCHDMGSKLAKMYTTRSGTLLMTTAFSKAAMHTRGLVGVVEVPGSVSSGDEVLTVRGLYRRIPSTCAVTLTPPRSVRRSRSASPEQPHRPTAIMTAVTSRAFMNRRRSGCRLLIDSSPWVPMVIPGRGLTC